MAGTTDTNASETRLNEFRRRREDASATGSEIRSTLDSIFDAGSFVEVDLFAALHTDDAKAQDLHTESGVAGFGTVDGRHIAAYGFDSDGFHGPLAEVIAQKVERVQQMAATNRVPVVAVLRGDEADDGGLVALAGWAGISARTARLREIVPQLCILEGNPSPAVQHLEALHDFSVAANEARTLLAYLPSSSDELAPFHPYEAESTGFDERLQRLLPVDGASDHDVRELIAFVADADSWFEVDASRSGVAAGFARLAGHVVGFFGNQPKVGGEIEAAGAWKADRFVRFCDAFGIPLVVVVDTPGVAADAGSVHIAASLTDALANASVPKFTVTTGRALGLGYVVMNPKQLGADLAVAWTTADIGSDGAPRGAHHLAVERGYVDDIIEPGETRRVLIRALEICLNR